MDQAVVDDLKQFITTTTSQQIVQHTVHLATKSDIENMATKDGINQLEERLGQRIDDLQDAVQQSAINYTAALDDQVQDHEKRLNRLEGKTA